MNEWMNHSITEVFIKQPLALSGSANKQTKNFAKSFSLLNDFFFIKCSNSLQSLLLFSCTLSPLHGKLVSYPTIYFTLLYILNQVANQIMFWILYVITTSDMILNSETKLLVEHPGLHWVCKQFSELLKDKLKNK